MSREPLPTRRRTENITMEWAGHEIDVTLGYREAFADVAKGGGIQWVVADACTILSVALQHGISVAELSKSVGRVPDVVIGNGATKPASPIGAILDALSEVGE